MRVRHSDSTIENTSSEVTKHFTKNYWTSDSPCRLNRIERLMLELDKPSAYSESLKSLNRRLDEVSAELLGGSKRKMSFRTATRSSGMMPSLALASKGAGAKESASAPSEPVHDQKAVATFERHARKLVEQYGAGIEPGKADLLVAVKMVQGGWTPNQVTDGVQVAGFKTSVLRGAELIAHAGKISQQASNAADHTRQQQVVSRGVER